MKHLLTAIACCLAVAGSAQTWNPDADFDNVIGVEDLMALLSVFGTEWTEEYPQNPEYELAAYHAGDMDYFECVRTCRDNNAKIIGLSEYAIFRDSIEVVTGGDGDFHLDDWRGYHTASYHYTGQRLTLGMPSIIYFYDYHCFCTGLVPVVE